MPVFTFRKYHSASTRCTGAIQLQAVSANLDTVQSNLDQCFQSASDGKKAIADAITGLGLSTSANLTFAELASRIKSKLIYPTTKTVSGSFSASVNNYNGGSKVVSFGVTFKSAPTVKAAVDTSWMKVSVSNITTGSCTITWDDNSASNPSGTVTWSATGEVLN